MKLKSSKREIHEFLSSFNSSSFNLNIRTNGEWESFPLVLQTDLKTVNWIISNSLKAEEANINVGSSYLPIK